MLVEHTVKKSFNEDEVLNQAVEFWASSVSSGKQKEAQILWREGSVSLLVMLYSQYTFFFGRVGPDFLKVISYFYPLRNIFISTKAHGQIGQCTYETDDD